MAESFRPTSQALGLLSHLPTRPFAHPPLFCVAPCSTIAPFDVAHFNAQPHLRDVIELDLDGAVELVKKAVFAHGA